MVSSCKMNQKDQNSANSLNNEVNARSSQVSPNSSVSNSSKYQQQVWRQHVHCDGQRPCLASLAQMKVDNKMVFIKKTAKNELAKILVDSCESTTASLSHREPGEDVEAGGPSPPAKDPPTDGIEENNEENAPPQGLSEMAQEAVTSAFDPNPFG